MQVSRRNLISGTLATSIFGRPIFASAQIDPFSAGTEGLYDTATEGLGVAADFLRTNPYVQGAVVAAQVIGFFSTQAFQNATTVRLSRIESKLDEVSDNVKKVLSIISRLPEYITRAISENEKNVLLNELNSKDMLVRGILKNYVRSDGIFDPTKLTLEAAKELRTQGQIALEVGFKLQGWGSDAFLSIAQAHGLFEMCADAVASSGKTEATFMSVKEARRLNEEAFERSNAVWLANLTKAQLIEESGRRFFDQFPRNILLGYADFGNSVYRLWVARLGGGANGFSYESSSFDILASSSSYHPEYVSIGGAPGFENFGPSSMDEEHGKMRLRALIDVLNSRVASQQILAANSSEALAIERSAFLLKKLLRNTAG